MHDRRRYVYASERRDGAVRRRYIGRADSEAVRQYREQTQSRRDILRDLRKRAALLDLLDTAGRDLSELETEAMRERGYEQNEQRKWKPCRYS